MFRYVSEGLSQATTLLDLGVKLYDVHKSPAAAILCLDHAFRNSWKLQTATAFEVASMLHGFVIYIRELGKYAVDGEPTQQVYLQKLFGFYPSGDSDGNVSVRERTMLYDFALHATTREPKLDISFRQDTAGLLLLPAEFAKLLKAALSVQIVGRIRDENKLCRAAPVFNLCPTFVVFGSCNYGQCELGHGVTQISPALSCVRLQIVLQQILIYETLRMLNKNLLEVTDQRCKFSIVSCSTCANPHRSDTGCHVSPWQ